ncbi:hypothetical protein AB4Z48_17565 [Cupriavidus sp. 2TAF22]|uniref:hypothetical protein n=1 Tax=unclassified Cupriavidus TaxID=2640874 RepID=UPI003F8FD098
MGNSKLSAGCQIHEPDSAEPAGPSENGILARVPGNYISDAGKQLPPPSYDGPTEGETVILGGQAGLVRIFFRRMIARRGKHSHCFWAAYRAEPVDGAE